MTPEDFKHKMLDIYPRPDVDGGPYSTEMAHVVADELMCKVLKGLGYGEGVDAYRKADKWHA